MVSFIDIHCHLDFKETYDRMEEVVDNAKKEGVNVILTNGIDKKSNRVCLELAEKFPEIKAALGFYPPEVSKEEFDMKEFEEELKFIEENKEHIHAIGEIGMDYKHFKDKELQKHIFTEMVKLATKLDKPMLIHSRKAEEDVIDILEELQAKKVVMHCFSGRKHLVKRAADVGFSFSIPTNVVRAESFQMVIDLVPLSQLFAETDAPFLSPFKDKSNEPAFVVESYKKIAEIKKMTVEEVKNNIFMNWQRIL